MSTNFPHKARAIVISFLIGFATGVLPAAYFLHYYGYSVERQMQAAAPPSPQLRQKAWTQDQIDQLRPLQTPKMPVPQPGPIEEDFAKHGASLPMIPESPAAMLTDHVTELRQRDLLLPLSKLRKQDLRDSFSESRGNHIHEAIDILAPRNTPILAVEDGSIARLWYSVHGGVTIYQFDSMQRYEYYYAHLENYAHGLKEGDRVRRGQVIGYVGTSGNAPKDTPHLHFTIFKLTEQKQWWKGTPVNPYLVFKGS